MPTLSGSIAGTARLTLSLALAALAACGGGSDGDDGGTGPNPASTTYTGFMTADDGSSAGLALTFATAVSIRAGAAALSAPVSVNGVISAVGGGTISISGSVDAGSFTATGGGLTLTGTLEDGVLNGRFTGTGGVQGGFAAAAASAGHEVYAFCGRYEGEDIDTGDPESGNWHALVSGTAVVGDILPDGTTADAFLTGFLGEVSPGPEGTTVVDVNISAGDQSLTAHGVIDAAKHAMGGTYSKRFPGVAGQSSDGSFAGDRCPGT